MRGSREGDVPELRMNDPGLISLTASCAEDHILPFFSSTAGFPTFSALLGTESRDDLSTTVDLRRSPSDAWTVRGVRGIHVGRDARVVNDLTDRPAMTRGVRVMIIFVAYGNWVVTRDCVSSLLLLYIHQNRSGTCLVINKVFDIVISRCQIIIVKMPDNRLTGLTRRITENSFRPSAGCIT